MVPYNELLTALNQLNHYSILMLPSTKDGGILGIAVNKFNKTGEPDSHGKPDYVYLYFTAQKKQNENGTQLNGSTTNSVYRYEFVNNTLGNARLLLDLPAGYHHDRVPILIGPDNQSVYVSVGDVENQYYAVIPNKDSQ